MLVEPRPGWRAYLELASRLLREAAVDSEVGLRAAVSAFAPAGWLPTAGGAGLARADACTGCEACNAVCPLLGRGNPVVFAGPMEVPLRLFRAAPDFRAARPVLEIFRRCGTCRACQDCCPQQVPILELVRSMQRALDAGEPEPVAATRTAAQRHPAGPG